MTTQTPTLEATTTLPTGDWTVDPSRSTVHFRTRAMLGFFPVLGRFERFSGALHVDESGRASGELQIHAASINTGIKKRDEHLRHEDFFAADTHPHVTFKLSDLRPDGLAHRVDGTLQIRDKTLPIHADATVAADGEELRIEARLPVDHDAAGLGWAKPGMVRRAVDADIKLTLTRER